MEIKECLIRSLIETIPKATGLDEKIVEDLVAKRRLKLARTPDPKYGDYGVALHVVLHMVKAPRQEWDRLLSRIADEIMGSSRAKECFIHRIEYSNGYLNFYIDYKKLSRIIFKKIIDEALLDEIRYYGRGEKVLVEHTSANPIHPLHIGSGRNAVIGNTFARILRRLGFSVREHFYVDDMGRQVAVMVYGYMKVKGKGIEPPPEIKPDHWIGAIYALTNILVSIKTLHREQEKIAGKIKILIQNLKEEATEKRGDGYLLAVSRIAESQLSLKHDLGAVLEMIVSALKKQEGKRPSEVRRKAESLLSRYSEVRDKLAELYECAEDLRTVFPRLYDVLYQSIDEPEVFEEKVSELMKLYEEEDPRITSLFREAIDLVLRGFESTLRRIGIVFDSYDWESDPEIKRLTREIIEASLKTRYGGSEGQAVIVDLGKAYEEDEYIHSIFGAEKPERVVLRRSDGTTLYVSRDIAYTIYKYRVTRAKKVYNVIATEQNLEQKQVRSILYLLGYEDYADNTIHLAYEMVHLKGYRMRGRYGRYISLDELIERYRKLMLDQYMESRKKLGVEEAESALDRAEKLAVANTRYLLLSIEPLKVLTFDPKKLAEHTEGSWIQYTYARLLSILRKAYGKEIDEPDDVREEVTRDYDEINFDAVDLAREEEEIVEKLMSYKDVLVTAYEEMKPNKVAEYAYELSSTLNLFYEKIPVIKEKDVNRKKFRLVLIYCAAKILGDAMYVMGLPVLPRI